MFSCLTLASLLWWHSFGLWCFFVFSLCLRGSKNYAGNMWSECWNMHSLWGFSQPSSPGLRGCKSAVRQQVLVSVLIWGENGNSFMSFVTSSWKKRRNVRSLEKGLNNVSIHSNKFKRKLLDSDFLSQRSEDRASWERNSPEYVGRRAEDNWRKELSAIVVWVQMIRWGMKKNTLAMIVSWDVMILDLLTGIEGG